MSSEIGRYANEVSAMEKEFLSLRVVGVLPPTPKIKFWDRIIETRSHYFMSCVSMESLLIIMPNVFTLLTIVYTTIFLSVHLLIKF